LEYIEMIQRIQEEKCFYFSYDIDLTKNIQSTVQECQNNNPGGGNQYNLPHQNYLTMKEAYPNSVDYIGHYAFNDRLLGEFQGIEYSPFKVPCIFGYVFVSSPVFKNGQNTEFYLISRKDCRRPGRRFITRGLDSEGCAANFVETEHIFVQFQQSGLHVASYVQIRGSIPLVWSMKPNLKWAPPVKVKQNFSDSIMAAE